MSLRTDIESIAAPATAEAWVRERVVDRGWSWKRLAHFLRNAHHRYYSDIWVAVVGRQILKEPKCPPNGCGLKYGTDKDCWNQKARQIGYKSLVDMLRHYDGKDSLLAKALGCHPTTISRRRKAAGLLRRGKRK